MIEILGLITGRIKMIGIAIAVIIVLFFVYFTHRYFVDKAVAKVKLEIKETCKENVGGLGGAKKKYANFDECVLLGGSIKECQKMKK